MRLNTKQSTVNLIFTAFLVILTAWAVFDETVTYRPWKKYQKEFKQIEKEAVNDQLQAKLAEKGSVQGEEAEKLNKDIEFLQRKLKNTKARPIIIKQNWLLQFNNEADRCVTCHQAVEKSGFENQENPFRTHSGDYIENHPVQTFGCITCHDGESHALTLETAHGHAENWLKPLLSGSYSQAKCVKCHKLEQDLPLDIKMAGGEKVVRGWKLYMENNCLGCHVNSLYDRPKRIAPVLTNVGIKVNKEWIRKWIKNPKDYLPKTLMPNFLLKDEEIDLVAAYLLSLAEGRKIDEPMALERLGDKEAIESGKKLVGQLGCTGCHSIGGKGGDFAPDLSDIASKTYPEWMFYWVKDPKVYQPEAPMPNLRIPDDELKDIVAYIDSLKNINYEETYIFDSSIDTEKAKQGREILKDKGCTGCHEIDKFPMGFNAPPHDGVASKRPEELVWTNMEDYANKNVTNWLSIKVKEPRKFSSVEENIITRMPKFNFSDEDVEALITFIMSFSKETFPKKHIVTLASADSVEMKGRKLLEERNCLACHKINKKGGDIAPDLSDEGKKARPEWLFSFLTNPHRIRPLQDARMPYFKMQGDNITTVIEYLAFVAGEKYPYIYEDKKVVYVEDIDEGKKLYQQELACMGCHTFEGKGGFVGPEHTDMASRLRRDWVQRWLENPQAIQPDVRMPRFILKKDELEYLTDYLMTMGRERFLEVQ